MTTQRFFQSLIMLLPILSRKPCLSGAGLPRGESIVSAGNTTGCTMGSVLCEGRCSVTSSRGSSSGREMECGGKLFMRVAESTRRLVGRAVDGLDEKTVGEGAGRVGRVASAAGLGGIVGGGGDDGDGDGGDGDTETADGVLPPSAGTTGRRGTGGIPRPLPRAGAAGDDVGPAAPPRPGTVGSGLPRMTAASPGRNTGGGGRTRFGSPSAEESRPFGGVAVVSPSAEIRFSEASNSGGKGRLAGRADEPDASCDMEVAADLVLCGGVGCCCGVGGGTFATADSSTTASPSFGRTVRIGRRGDKPGRGGAGLPRGDGALESDCEVPRGDTMVVALERECEVPRGDTIVGALGAESSDTVNDGDEDEDDGIMIESTAIELAVLIASSH